MNALHDPGSGSADLHVRRGLGMQFSVLLSVYHRESPLHFGECLESLASQTVPPQEVVIVKDGPIGPDLENVITLYREMLKIATVDLPVNRGLGAALCVGVASCHFDWVARMDADDICVPHRFEKQIEFLKEHQEVDILGSSISEFELDPISVKSIRSLPEHHEAIRAFAKLRNPLNHMTVFFRKQAVLDAGNYREIAGFEDYDLWVRMLMRGYQFRNILDPLVLARCGNGMQQRRGSVKYAWRESTFFWSLRKLGFLNLYEFVRNIAFRLPVRLLPTGFRTWIYHGYLRRTSVPAPNIEEQDPSD